MGLAEFQAALARAYTDPEFRRAIVEDPTGVRQVCNLDDDDLQRLRDVSSQQLDFFAASLVSKRRGEVAKLLPRTASALGDQFRVRFAAFSGNFVPFGRLKHVDDALAFAKYLSTLADIDLSTADCALYEAEWLRIRSSRSTFRVRLIRGGLPDHAGSRAGGPVIAIWMRTRGSGVRHWALPLGRAG